MKNTMDYLTIALPKGKLFSLSADLLAKAIVQEKVAFVPGRAFFADGSGANHIRLSFSCANETMIDEGIKRIGRLLKSEIGAA